MNTNGIVVYRGPSAIDGSAILGILTGLRRRSNNPKTGNMLQLWIIPQNLSPIQARRDNLDQGMCGDCPVRSGCYVEWKNAPQQIWHSFHRWSYASYDPARHDSLIRGRRIRLGACGEPVALPYRLVKRLTQLSGGWTGYTHQWRNPRFRYWARLLMASVESPDGATEAISHGWRTFRVRRPNTLPILGELDCPASAESGHKTTCERCCLCGGQSRPARPVSIVAHGSRAKLGAVLRVVA